MLRKKDVIVLGIYTKNTLYADVIASLEKSCNKFNINFHKIGYKNTKSWFHNNNQKPKIIQQFLNEQKDDKVVWYLDSDAIIVKEPIFKLVDKTKPSFIFLEDRKLRTDQTKITDQAAAKSFASSKFLPKTKYTVQIINQWVDRLRVNLLMKDPPRLIEQYSLDEVLKENKDAYTQLHNGFGWKHGIYKKHNVTNTKFRTIHKKAFVIQTMVSRKVAANSYIVEDK